MRYIKVKVSFRFAPKRLYRVLLVPEQTTLLQFAKILGNSLHFEWEHMFMFRNGNTCFELEYNDFGDFFESAPCLLMKDCTIEDLGSTAVFEYDFGDGWEFNVRMYKKHVEREGDKEVWLLEGAGQGIWEDEFYSLISYLDGIIDDSYEIDEDSAFSLPWNFENTKFSDFDKPLDLELEQKYLENELKHELYFGDEDDDDGDDAVDVDDGEEDEDDRAAVLSEFLNQTDKMERFGTDEALQKWIDNTLAILRKKYGEHDASLLVMRMLMEGCEKVAALGGKIF